MEKTITVKGIGNVSTAPDTAVVSLLLKSTNRSYDRAMEYASEKLLQLQKALEAIGFAAADLKTESFNVAAEHRSERDKNGNYHSVFEGYSCLQRLKLEFALDTKLLSRVLAAIAECISEPELQIRFTVKDKAAVSEALLESAAANAKKKAQILTKASGVKLGELISIIYDWSELDVYSNTHYEVEENCLRSCGAVNFDITPDDIESSDSATFIFTIL